MKAVAMPTDDRSVPKAVSSGDTSTKRAWLLVAVATVACVVLAIVAVILTGTHRLMFGGASLVFLVLAITSAGIVATETSSKPRFDLEAPEPPAPLPQSPVTLIHDPGEPHNSSFESDAAKPHTLG